ncbi:MAG: hypothetical protein WAW90_01055 [Minisyncoccia bacterium]
MNKVKTRRYTLVVARVAMILFVMVTFFFGTTNKAEALTCSVLGYQKIYYRRHNPQAIFSCWDPYWWSACTVDIPSDPNGNACDNSGIQANWSTTYGCTVSSQVCTAGGYCSGGGTTGTCVNDPAAPTMSITPASGTSGTSISYTATWQDTWSGLNGTCYIILDGAWNSTACSGTGQKTYSGSFTNVGNHSAQLYSADVVGNATYTSAYYYTVVAPTCNPVSVSNGAVAAYPSCTITCNPGYTLSGSSCVPPATVTLSASPNPVIYSNASTLTWSSTNATSCAASGSWSGTKATSSSWSTGALITQQTYTLTCPGAGGTSTPSSVTVNIATPAATLTATPSTIDAGQSSMLTWSSTSANNGCVGTGFSTGGAANNSVGVSTGSLSATQPYQITCTGTGGSVVAAATVTVRVPTVTISAVPNRVQSGGATIVSWSAENVNSCTITKNGQTPAWKSFTTDASRALTGSVQDSITTQTTYVISCANDASATAVAATASQVVNPVPTFGNF